MFEFLRLPFGLRNAGQTFQWFMDQVLGGLPYCFVYVDDILVFSPDLSSHGVHLQEVLELCRLHGLTVGLPKCVFSVSEVEFLGHNLTSSGCRPLSKHTSAIKEFPTLTDKPALQRFLSMVNYQGRTSHPSSSHQRSEAVSVVLDNGIHLSSIQPSSLRHAYSSSSSAWFSFVSGRGCIWISCWSSSPTSNARKLVSPILLLQEAERRWEEVLRHPPTSASCLKEEVLNSILTTNL